MARALPPTASVAQQGKGDKLHAPAAVRNVTALADLLRAHAPTTGEALEIASGTGQHVGAFAAATPGLHWQPTDVEPDRLASTDAHVADAGVTNVARAALLDATKPGWSADHAGKSLIVLINLLHLIPQEEVKTLLSETAKALTPGGVFICYGPFQRAGQLTSAGDVTFDAQLRAADPAIGYKDDLDILQWLRDVGFQIVAAQEMPANNLAFVALKE